MDRKAFAAEITKDLGFKPVITPTWPLMLYESQAKRFGVSDDDIEHAKRSAMPVPKEWPVRQETFMIYRSIPVK